MPTCDLIIDNEVVAYLKGLDTETRRQLTDQFSYFIPSARFTPAFKLGRWNGRVNFFEVGGKTFVGLLDQILPTVIDRGYEVNLIDNRPDYGIKFDQIDENFLLDKKWPKGHTHEGEDILLRDYQVDIPNALFENHQGIVSASTGAGKTLITAILSMKIEDYGRSMVIVPSKHLVRQTAEDYENLGLDYGVYFGDEKVTDAKHTICTWQSLETAYKNRGKNDDLENLVDGTIGIINDEVHSASAHVLKKLLTTTLAHVPIRWGITGTIPKEIHAKQSLIASIGPIMEDSAVKSHELQEKGVLADLHIDILQTNDNDMPRFSNYSDEHQWLCKNPKRISFIGNKLNLIGKTGNTLILVDRIETGKKLLEEIPDGYFVSGSMPLKKRQEIFDKINTENNVTVIATYGTTSTGVNAPRIFNLVLFEAGKSFVRVIQTIGRGIRKAKDKDFVQVYDICSSSKYSTKHLSERKRFYRENKFEFTLEKIDYE